MRRPAVRVGALMRMLHWFRKDLRLEDNTALSEAVRDAAGDVVPFYSSEPTLLEREDMAATRVRFVLESLADLAAQLERLGFATTQQRWPGGATAALRRLEAFVADALSGYGTQRDVPGHPGTSRLSADLKFGTLSPRTIVAAAQSALANDPRLRGDTEKYIAELRWRDFYTQVLYHFPYCEQGCFKRAYDAMHWLGDPGTSSRGEQDRPAIRSSITPRNGIGRSRCTRRSRRQDACGDHGVDASGNRVNTGDCRYILLDRELSLAYLACALPPRQ